MISHGQTQGYGMPFPVAERLRLSKKWLAPLFRGFHSSLAPTARPGSYAGKPLLRKAFCGFAVHPPGGLLLSLRDNSPCAAKSDESLKGPRSSIRQRFFDKLKSGTLPQFAKVATRRRESGFRQLPCALGFRLASSATGGARLPPPAPRWPGFPYSPGGRKAAQKAILSRSTRSCGCPGRSFRRGRGRFSTRILGWS